MTKFIAIDGHGGSGKSTLAKELAEELGAEIIHVDDFASFDNWSNWWPLVIDQVFKPIRDGATNLSYPRSKWWEDHEPEPVVGQPVTNIMILEGVSSLRKEFREYVDFGAYVDTPKEVCLQRGLARDKGKDGKTDQEILQLWDKWLKNEEEYIAKDNPHGYADIIVDGTKSFDVQINNIKELL
jgi:uridine kinase